MSNLTWCDFFNCRRNPFHALVSAASYLGHLGSLPESLGDFVSGNIYRMFLSVWGLKARVSCRLSLKFFNEFMVHAGEWFIFQPEEWPYPSAP